MKKEICALILLIVMFSASLINIHFLEKLTGEIASLVEEAEGFISEEKWDEARERAEKARDKWEKSENYTHMVLRHSEIETAGETLSELIKEVYEENAGAAKGAAKAAATRMKSVASIEKIKLGSIF